MTNSSTPKSIRRIINCAKALMRRQGLPRRRAITAAFKICARSSGASHTRPVNLARSETALEYLQHRQRTMSMRRI